jgi:enoyl-CoA hydratase/carnithine racemase
MKLIYEVNDRIARITINRPEAMNAMDADVYAELSSSPPSTATAWPAA